MDDNKAKKLTDVRQQADYFRNLLKAGDVLTHTRCMGCLEEHIFIGWDGLWMVGIPTKDTMLLGNLSGKDTDHVVNDISPGNVTHINRVPVESVEFLASVQGKA